MADVIPFHAEDAAFYRRYVREHLPERKTHEIIKDLKPLRMLGEEDAVLRSVLFAELVVKSEGVFPCPT